MLFLDQRESGDSKIIKISLKNCKKSNKNAEIHLKFIIFKLTFITPKKHHIFYSTQIRKIQKITLNS